MWGSMFRIMLSVSVNFLLPTDVRLSLLLQHHVCLHSAMLSIMMIMDGTSETVSEPSQLNIFLIRVVVVMVIKTLTKTVTKSESKFSASPPGRFVHFKGRVNYQKKEWS